MSILSPHFTLAEFIPHGMDEAAVPVDVLQNLTALAEEIMEPLRAGLDVPVVIHDGWRLPAQNDAAGGVPHSDHLVGAAADFHTQGRDGKSWEDMTFAAFDWIRENLDGVFGQLILEDHRAHYGVPGKLWLHVSLKGPKHDGTEADANRLLVSYAPRSYAPWVDGRFS